jgi:hypothetical protein
VWNEKGVGVGAGVGIVSLRGKQETGALAEGDNVRSNLPGFRSPLELLHLIYSAIDAVLSASRLCHSMTSGPLDSLSWFSRVSSL